MSSVTDSEAETRLLLEAGRAERPTSALLGRTLAAVRHESEQLSRGVAVSHRAVMSGILLAAAASVLLFVLYQPAGQGRSVANGSSGVLPVLSAERLAVKARPLASRAADELAAAQDQTRFVTPPSSRAAPNRGAEGLHSGRTPAPAVHNGERSQPAVVLPSAAELAARQRLDRELQDRQAAAAKAAAAAPALGVCVPSACSVVRPSDPLISDFEDVGPSGVFVDGDAYSSKPADWWQRFYGSTYVYPARASGLTQITRKRWRVMGHVNEHSGFGLWLGACLADFSEYRGVSFDLSGQAGPSGVLTFWVDTHENSVPETCRTNVGDCDRDAGSCVSPNTRLKLPLGPGAPIVVLWEELTGGHPRATPQSESIIQLRWSFDWPLPGGDQRGYPVDLSIDNVRLVR